MDHFQANDLSEGITADDIKHLVGGNVATARSHLHRMADQKLIKKKVVRIKDDWSGARCFRKIAMYYPLQKN